MKTVILCPSHQLNNKCIWGDTEAKHCLNIASQIYDILLKDKLISPVLIGTAPDTENTEALRRKWAIAKSNKYEAALHIGIHTNAGGSNGVEAIYYSAEGAKAAKALISPLVGLFGTRIPLTYENKTLEELNSTKAVAVILEIGFHDNKSDAEIIHNKANNIAEILVDGLYNYFEINSPNYKSLYYNLLDKHVKLKTDIKNLADKWS